MLNKAPQPPLSYPGATSDSDRAKKPPLADPSPTGGELNPGDRVEGLGNFGVPTGQLGTVEQANEEDAVVKWDDDGRMRLHQPWLKKISKTNTRSVMNEKPSAILPGTVEKIIKSTFPSEPEKAQITVEGADHLYREIRIDNTLTNENGEEVSLKPGAQVEVTVQAEAEATTPKK